MTTRIIFPLWINLEIERWLHANVNCADYETYVDSVIFINDEDATLFKMYFSDSRLGLSFEDKIAMRKILRQEIENEEN